jgi:hypothetical protein
MRIIVSIALAVVSALLLAGPVAAHDPTAGAVAQYPSGTTLQYRFGGAGYPSWVPSASQAAFGPDWSNAAFNNARLPSFSYSASGSGAVYYSSSTASPCGTGNTQWLQCASNWGSTAWRIYIRNFDGAPYGAWTWCNIAFSGTCWDAERALLHEAEHVVLGVAGHDPQGESNTIMGSVAPWYATTGWNTHHIQRCDESAAQLLTGLGSPSGPLADCFDHIAGHGVAGLLPSLTDAATSVAACLSQVATLSGSFGVAPDARYQALAGQGLAGRTIWFDRKLHTATTWTLNVASAVTGPGSANWSRGFSTGSATTITYDIRPHSVAEPGLDPATAPVVTVTWRSVC